MRQLDRMAMWLGKPALPREIYAPLLLQIERISDAIAEGELDDLGVTPIFARGVLVELLRRLGK